MKDGILGNAIRKARIENNISQEELAELVDVSTTHIKHIESEHRKPSIEILFKLSKILHLSLDNLIFDISEETHEYKNALNLLNECNTKELKILADIIKSLIENR